MPPKAIAKHEPNITFFIVFIVSPLQRVSQTTVSVFNNRISGFGDQILREQALSIIALLVSAELDTFSVVTEDKNICVHRVAFFSA
jgi:hypothetical protein